MKRFIAIVLTALTAQWAHAAPQESSLQRLSGPIYLLVDGGPRGRSRF